jgi:hypothetical protein
MQSWLLRRLPRDPACLLLAAARLDDAALATGGAVTPGLARAVLPDLLLPRDATARPGDGRACCFDDDSAATGRRCSPGREPMR